MISFVFQQAKDIKKTESTNIQCSFRLENSQIVCKKYLNSPRVIKLTIKRVFVINKRIYICHGENGFSAIVYRFPRFFLSNFIRVVDKCNNIILYNEYPEWERKSCYVRNRRAYRDARTSDGDKWVYVVFVAIYAGR